MQLGKMMRTLLNVVGTSLLLVSWQVYTSFNSHVNVIQDDIDYDAPHIIPNRSLRAVEDATSIINSESQRWDHYRNVYNYLPPNYGTDGVHPIATSGCGTAPDFAAYFEQSLKHRSSKNEDKIIYEAFFKGRLTGSGAYVELGAFDGKTESNSRFFDKCLGWKGLLMEGNPTTYSKTTAARPNAHRLSFSPTCQQTGMTVEMYNYPMANSGLKDVALEYKGKPTISVPCGPLGPVLQDIFQGETIHFFSLDVEGAEAMVLETIDFTKVKIDVLMVEVDSRYCKKDCPTRDRVRQIMKNANYIRREGIVRGSDIYIHPRTTFTMNTNDGKSSSVSKATTTTGTSVTSDANNKQVATISENVWKTVPTRLMKYRDMYNFLPPTKPFVEPASECGAAPNFPNFFAQPAKFRSRFKEDYIVYTKFFDHNMPPKGTYIELGAFDGHTESNTRFFDVCLGWKGLLIEGNPTTYMETTKARPQAHRMSFAPSCKDQSTVQFYKYPMANSGLEGKAMTYEGYPMVTVPCGPLGPVLEDLFGPDEHINFFSLDVEGAEPMVLETIDFTKVKIDVLMVEVQNTFCQEDCESREQTRAIMKRAGYKRYGNIVTASDIYVHPNSPYQLPY